MLPKENRLKKDKDFERVHKEGKFSSYKFLAVKVAENDLKVSRFGFLVGIKVSKKAVVRNKVKRRLRESVRMKLDRIKSGFDVVVIVRPEIAEESYVKIDEAVIEVLKRARLFKE
jgi:ribonuclease P protein component